jgi:hypothetical protein
VIILMRKAGIVNWLRRGCARPGRWARTVEGAGNAGLAQAPRAQSFRKET